MADLTITAANVAPSTGAVTRYGTAGETITAGQSVYLDSVSGKYKKADADAEATAEAVGIALTGSSDGQPIAVQYSGRITMGATVAVGQIYVVSTTAGGVAVYGDLASGDYVTILGVGATTGAIDLYVTASGIAKA
jgi:hypothetical protein